MKRPPAPVRREEVSGWPIRIGVLLLCFFLERCVLNRFPLWGGTPLLMPLAVASIGFLEGSGPGAVCGLGAGLASALAMGSDGTALIWFDTAIGLACGATLDKALGRTFPGYLLCALVTMLLWEGLQSVIHIFFLGDAADAVLALAGAEGGYSLIFAPVLYLVFLLLHDRFRSELEF
ncbi:MAG: hypothetical protein LUF81_03240 [Clostridiales bacterium]|nr:hypothetical protein [Clostridiales bacterium]